MKTYFSLLIIIITFTSIITKESLMPVIQERKFIVLLVNSYLYQTSY